MKNNLHNVSFLYKYICMVLIKKIYAKMQKSFFNFHKFSFQSYKFVFFHFSPLIFIPSQLSYNFFYIKFFFKILEKTLIKKKKKKPIRRSAPE